MFRERAPNAVAPMGRSNEDAGKPRSELWMGVHLMVDKHGRAEQLCGRGRNERDGKVGAA
jgi:hypothetical protein